MSHKWRAFPVEAVKLKKPRLPAEAFVRCDDLPDHVEPGPIGISIVGVPSTCRSTHRFCRVADDCRSVRHAAQAGSRSIANTPVNCT